MSQALLALPALAQLYFPMLWEERLAYSPDFYAAAIYGHQVEQGTCQRLHDGRC